MRFFRREYRRVLFYSNRYHFGIISIILIVIGLIGIRLLIVNNILTNDFAESNKELVDLLDKSIKLVIFIFAAIISYLRFFKGRTFNERMNIELNEKVAEYSSQENILIGEMKLINTGNFPINGIKISYSIINIGNSKEMCFKDFNSLRLKQNEEFTIETNETAQFQFYELIDKKVKFCRIDFKFITKNHLWKRELIFENKQKKE